MGRPGHADAVTESMLPVIGKVGQQQTDQKVCPGTIDLKEGELGHCVIGRDIKSDQRQNCDDHKGNLGDNIRPDIPKQRPGKLSAHTIADQFQP